VKPSGRGVLSSCNARVTPTLLAVLLLMALLAPWLARAEKPQDLKPQGYLNDFAGVISQNTRTKLTALCTELDQKAHAQIAIVTVHTLDGDSIEDYSIEVAQKWGVGSKSNRGVLILLAVDDHKYRVEVGYGLEDILPDGKVGGFGRDMVPALRRGDYSGAVLQLTGSIATVIAQVSGVTLNETPAVPHYSFERDPLMQRVILALIVLFFLGFAGVFLLVTLAGLFGPVRGPSMGGGFGGSDLGGFGGGGGGGGGGFGGFGGGSFGGGGASGSW
jgi:uncharacterized protein